MAWWKLNKEDLWEILSGGKTAGEMAATTEVMREATWMVLVLTSESRVNQRGTGDRIRRFRIS